MALDDKEHFSQIENRLDKVEGRVTATESDLGWYNSATKICGTFVTLVGALAILFGTAFVRDQARQVFNEQIKASRTITQTGKWTEANRLADGSFEWTLAESVKPEDVLAIETYPLTAVPGVFSSAEVSKDGKKCIMRLTGSPESLKAIPLPVEARTTITLAK